MRTDESAWRPRGGLVLRFRWPWPAAAVQMVLRRGAAANKAWLVPSAFRLLRSLQRNMKRCQAFFGLEMLRIVQVYLKRRCLRRFVA